MTHGVKVGLKTLGLLYASSVKASVEECTKAFQWTLLVTLYVIVFIFCIIHLQNHIVLEVRLSELNDGKL